MLPKKKFRDIHIEVAKAKAAAPIKSKSVGIASGIDELKSGLLELPSAIQAIYKLVDESGRQNGQIAIEALDSNSETFVHTANSIQLSLGRLESLAHLADKAGLVEHQSPKGIRELNAIIKQSPMTLAYLASREGYHRVQHNGEVVQFLVWRSQVLFFDEKPNTLALRILIDMPSSVPSAGTLEDWQKEIGAHVVANPYLLVVASAAIASLMCRAFGLPTVVLILVGGSSQGKTTALKVGQSLIKSGEVIESFSGTTKGIIAYLGCHHDCPVFMDEIRQADDPAAIIKLIFDLSNGASRKTSTADQSSQQTDALSCGLVTANESTLAEITAGTRVTINEGVAARVLELMLQAPHGAFHTLPDGMDAKQLSEHLQHRTESVFGSAWDALVPYVAMNASNIKKYLEKQLPLIEEELKADLPINDPITIRLVRGLAVWVCAGLIAVRAKVLLSERKTVMAAVRLVLEEQLKRTKNGSHQIADQVVETMRSCIEQNRNKFPSWASYHTHTQSGIYGYYRSNANGGVYLVHLSAFDKLLGQRFGKDAAARALQKAGYLKHDKDGYQYQCRVPKTVDDRIRFYAIDGAIRFDT